MVSTVENNRNNESTASADASVEALKLYDMKHEATIDVAGCGLANRSEVWPGVKPM